MPNIKFSPEDRNYTARIGTELSKLPELYPDIPLRFGCRQGNCGVCAIHIIQGESNLSPKTKQEIATLNRLEINQKRLACQCALKGDITILI